MLPHNATSYAALITSWFEHFHHCLHPALTSDRQWYSDGSQKKLGGWEIHGSIFAGLPDATAGSSVPSAD
jgi:hypothetical protein